MTSIEVSEEQGVRYLHFGSRWIQGAMRVARPYALELAYTRDMMLSLLLRTDPAWPRDVLHVGLGAASLLKFLLRYRPHARHTVVEIDSGVVGVARQYFKLPSESARIRLQIADGSEYIQCSDREFDLILVDGFDAKGFAGMLDTLPFYCGCQARLSAAGVLATNLLQRTRGVRPSMERLGTAFDGRALALPPCESGNTIALAAKGAPIERSFAELARAAQRLRIASGLNLVPTVARMKAFRVGGTASGLRF
jgi:spermidine synthase